MSKITKKVLLPSYLSISEYATKKGVARRTIYNHIGKGIVVELVGEGEHPYIDWDKYHDYPFPTVGQPKKDTK